MVHDVAEFLVRQPPFDELDGDALERLAATVEIEFFPAGRIVFAQGAEPASHAHLIRTGAIELLDEGRVLDLLGEGELFGHASMLSGLPTGFAARAHEDTLCYRLPAEAIIPLLSGPRGLQFVARSLRARSQAGPAAGIGADMVDDPGSRAVESLLRAPAVLVEPDTTIRRAAELMTEARVSAVVVQGGNGAVGIVTDRDLRTQVVAGDVPADAAVSSVMTAELITAAADELGDKVLMDMLAAGVRHMPVLAADGTVLGVLEAQDLLVAEGRAPFRLRRAIDTAPDVTTLVEVAGQIRPALTELHDARVAPEQIAAILALLIDALTRRLIELGIERHGAAPTPFAWLTLGSMGRAECAPSSDLDSALVWEGDDDDPEIQRWTGALAGDVLDGLRRCGLRGDTHGADATDVRFARSADAWQEAMNAWIANPHGNQGLIYLSLLADARVLWGAGAAAPVLHRVRDVRHDPRLLRLFAQLALNDRPPTGFLRDSVLDETGSRRRRLDIKGAGLSPVTSLARYAGLAAGSSSPKTPRRLAAAAGSVIAEEEARTLTEAFHLMLGLRIEHQLGQIRAGLAPDDQLDAGALNPLTRRYLREAFRAVTGVQRAVQRELGI
jgi:CBS domain-containing protein